MLSVGFPLKVVSPGYISGYKHTHSPHISYQTNCDVYCFILGPSRKTFIFIKSRVGQFGKPHFDISVLIIAAALRFYSALFLGMSAASHSISL